MELTENWSDIISVLYKRPFRRQNRSRGGGGKEKTGGRHSIQYSYSFLVGYVYTVLMSTLYSKKEEKRKLNLRFTFIAREMKRLEIHRTLTEQKFL